MTVMENPRCQVKAAKDKLRIAREVGLQKLNTFQPY
jgi:hypothetical protein